MWQRLVERKNQRGKRLLGNEGVVELILSVFCLEGNTLGTVFQYYEFLFEHSVVASITIFLVLGRDGKLFSVCFPEMEELSN